MFDSIPKTLTPYHMDMGEFKPREIKNIYTPETIEQIQEIVAKANADKEHLYTISTGKNWGLGSKKPVKSHSSIVDLRNLNKIRELNLEKGYAIIEPGVSQQQLHNALIGTDWIANFTHSCASTSIIGNSLEKGVGTFHQRTKDIIAFEAITGEGKLIRTGAFWHKMEKDIFYDENIGPNVFPLFFQSNFVIITATVFKLIPRPESMKLMEIKFKHSVLEQAMNQLQKAYKHDLFNTIFKIYNDHAHKNYGYQDDDSGERSYIGYGVVYGHELVVDAKLSEASKLLKETEIEVQIHSYNDQFEIPNSDISPTLQKMNASIPTSDAIASLSCEGDLDVNSKEGWVLIPPVVPFTGADILKATEMYHQKEREYGIEVNTTFNVLSANAIDVVTSIRFNRSEKEKVQLVHKVLDELHIAFKEAKYYPYRCDIDHQTKELLYEDETYYDVLKKLKQAFDPNGILSPGRYGIEL